MSQAQSVTATFAAVQYALSVTPAGSGTGTVTSSPAGITCGATCSANFNGSTAVVLTAVANSGYSFTGWSGACSGAATTCTVTMSQAQSVTATFGSLQYSLSVTKSGAGQGGVTSSPYGIDCGTTCSANFGPNTTVTLTATPAAGSSFKGWTGACNGADTSCTVTMSGANLVNASFSAQAISTYFYDPNGNLTQMTDPLGRVRTASYDALDQTYLTMEPHPTAIGGTLGQISAAYDGQGQIAGIIDPRGLSTNYTVDGLGNVLTIQSPDSGTTQNGYDEAGNLKTSTNAKGQTTTFQYDALNRLTRAAYADGQAFTYGYDQGSNGIGHLTSAGDGTSLTQWTYDNQGRVSGKSQSLRGRTLTVGYGYGPGGRIERITYPSGHILAYGYDSAGRITSLTVDGTTLLSGITYVPFGPPKGWTWGNGTTHQRSYDASGRLTSITLPAEPADSQTYGYDGLDRLTDASMANGTTNLNYLYDLSGNRVQQTKGTQVTSYTISPSSNRLTMVNTSTISSDANGSITSDGTNGFTYDARGRLTSANGTSYQIDALGQRIEKAGTGANTPSGARQFVYDEQHHLIGEYDRTSGTPIAEHVYFGDWPVAVIQNGTIYYVHPDHLGAPRTVTRPSDNQVMWWWAREPFGTATAQSIANMEYNLRLPGQYADIETGASQNLFRDNYFSAFGRYGQPDPIGLAGGSWSTFAYVGGNPLTRFDRMGLRSEYQEDPTTPEACEALLKLVAYDNEVGALNLIWSDQYQALPRGDNGKVLPTLNSPYDSVLGPVDADWMLRVSAYGAGGNLSTGQAIFGLGKPLWNVGYFFLRGFVDKVWGDPNPFAQLGDRSYLNAPVAAALYVGAGIPLRELFAPALQKCECKTH